MQATFKPALILLLVLTAITGIAYPLLVAAIGRATMPAQAEGSLVERDGRIVGSALIGQNFTDPKYFWGRLSATAVHPYNGAASGGSNLGPLNPALPAASRARVEALRAADPGNAEPVPVDLATASASGLDPQISPAAARYQMRRIARLRGIAPERLQALIDEHTEGRQFGLLGEPRVNVLALNLALDRLR